MTAKCLTILLLVALILTFALAEVIVITNTNPIYVRSPRLRIRGTGFEDAKDDIILELGAPDQPLRAEVDYLLSKDADGDGIVLKLVSNRLWATLTNLTPPVPITLTSIKFGADSTKNLLLAPVVVATVLPVPSLKANEKTIKATEATLRINGTGLVGSKRSDLYFQPQLIAGTHYDDVSEYPLVNSELVLNLKEGYKWRNDSGPLTVMGIDTGAGFVKLNLGDGVVVANVGTSSTSGSSSGAAAPAVEFIDIPSDKTEKSKSSSSGKKEKESSNVMKFVDVFSSAFGGGSSSSKSSTSGTSTASSSDATTGSTTSATTSTSSGSGSSSKQTSAVQFVDIPTLAAGAAVNQKESKSKTTSTPAANLSEVQFVDVSPKTTDATVTMTKATTVEDSTSQFAEVTAVLQKKIVKYSRLLDSAETAEEATKLADLMVKLTQTLNNLK
jgi:hypothetical protein